MQASRQLQLRGDEGRQHHGIPWTVARGAVRTTVFSARVVLFPVLILLNWSDRLTYLALFAAQGILLARVFLKAMGADASKPLPQTAYAVSSPLVAPFASGLHQLYPITVGPYVLEPATLAALAAYVIGAWFLVAFLNAIKRLVRLVT